MLLLRIQQIAFGNNWQSSIRVSWQLQADCSNQISKNQPFLIFQFKGSVIESASEFMDYTDIRLFHELYVWWMTKCLRCTLLKRHSYLSNNFTAEMYPITDRLITKSVISVPGIEFMFRKQETPMDEKCSYAAEKCPRHGFV